MVSIAGTIDIVATILAMGITWPDLRTDSTGRVGKTLPTARIVFNDLATAKTHEPSTINHQQPTITILEELLKLP